MRCREERGETAGKTVYFAESAFNATVYFGSRALRIQRYQRKRLEVFDVAFRVVIEDNSGI